MPESLKDRGPIFQKSYDELTKNLCKSLDLQKNLGLTCDYRKHYKNLIENLGQSYAKLMHTSYA